MYISKSCRRIETRCKEHKISVIGNVISMGFVKCCIANNHNFDQNSLKHSLKHSKGKYSKKCQRIDHFE